MWVAHSTLYDWYNQTECGQQRNHFSINPSTRRKDTIVQSVSNGVFNCFSNRPFVHCTFSLCTEYKIFIHLNIIEKWIFSRKTIILNSNDITIFSRKRISVTLCPANNFSRFSSSLLVSCLKVCTTVMYRGYFPQRVDKVKRSLASETLGTTEYFLNADLWWNTTGWRHVCDARSTRNEIRTLEILFSNWREE